MRRNLFDWKHGKGKDTVGYGIVKTTFDILEQNEYDIETELIGDAAVYQKKMAG